MVWPCVSDPQSGCHLGTAEVFGQFPDGLALKRPAAPILSLGFCFLPLITWYFY